MEKLTSEELERKRKDAHRAMRKNKEWLWEEDNGNLICRCKNCGTGHIIPFYAYENPYHYCYHCGRHNDPAEQQISFDDVLK